MADHEQPSPIGAEELHQPRLGVEVEVVGWLVEQQGLGLGEQDPRQLDAAPLAAGHGHHQLVELVCADAERRGETLRLGDGDVPAGCGELVVEPGEPADQPVALGAGGRLHGLADGFHPSFQCPDRPGGQDALQGGHLVVLELPESGLLREVADGSRADHRPLRRGRLTGENPHQGGLACPVVAHQADLVPRLQRQGHVGDEPAGAGVDTEVADQDHPERLPVGTAPHRW